PSPRFDSEIICTVFHSSLQILAPRAHNFSLGTCQPSILRINFTSGADKNPPAPVTSDLGLLDVGVLNCLLWKSRSRCSTFVAGTIHVSSFRDAGISNFPAYSVQE